MPSPFPDATAGIIKSLVLITSNLGKIWDDYQTQAPGMGSVITGQKKANNIQTKL